MSLGFFYYIQNTMIFIILSWAVYLVYRNGKLYYMPVAAMAVCSYLVALAMRDLGCPWFLATIGAMLIGGLLSLIFAPGLSRAPAFTVVVVTIGMLIIMTTIIRNIPILGGEMGFSGIPEVKNIFWKTVACVLVVGLLLYRFDHSRVGRAVAMTFIDPRVAAALGVNLFRVSIWLQVIAGALGGLAGSIYAATMPGIQIYSFNFETLLLVVCFIFVGGYSTMWGLVVMTPILYGIPIILPSAIADWRYLIYGGLLIGILILRPQGIVDKELLRKIQHAALYLVRMVSGRSKSVTGAK